MPHPLEASLAGLRQASEPPGSRRRLKIFLNTLLPSLALALVLLAAGLVVYYGYPIVRQHNQLRAAWLAAESEARQVDQPDLALLLAVEAVRAAKTDRAEGRLLAALEAWPRLQSSQRVHYGPVGVLAVSLNGQLAASTGEDGQILVWDTASHAQLYQLTLPERNNFTGLAFSQDGSRLASIQQIPAVAPTILIWDTATHGAIRPRLAAPPGILAKPVFNPNGSRLAAVSAGKVIVVWDLSQTAPISQTIALSEMWPSATATVAALAFTPGGDRLIAGVCSAILPEGGCQRFELVWWQAQTGQPQGQRLAKRLDQPAAIDRAVFSPDGRWLAVAGTDGGLQLWDIAASQAQGAAQVTQLTAHEGKVLAMAFNSDGTRLASSGLDGFVRLWQPGLTDPLLDLPVGATGSAISLVFLPGTQLLSGHADGSLRRWDSRAGRPVSPTIRQVLGRFIPGQAGAILEVQFSPDGRLLFARGADQVLSVWDLANGQLLYQTTDSPFFQSAFSQAGDVYYRFAAANLAILDFKPNGTFTERQVTIPTDAQATAAAFSPAKHLLAVGDDQGWIYLWDAPAGRLSRAPWQAHNAAVTALKFNLSGTLLVSGAADGSVMLQSSPSGEYLNEWDVEHGDRIIAIAVTPEGESVVAQTAAHNLEIWQVGFIDPNLTPGDYRIDEFLFTPDDRQLLVKDGGSLSFKRLEWYIGNQSLGGMDYDKQLVDAAFSPDGLWLAASYGASWWEFEPNGPCGGNEIRLWRVAPRQLFGPPLTEYCGSSNALAFSPDGQSLAAGGSAGTVIVYDLRRANWIDQACQLAGRNLSQPEWDQFFPGKAYRVTCPQWQVGRRW